MTPPKEPTLITDLLSPLREVIEELRVHGVERHQAFSSLVNIPDVVRAAAAGEAYQLATAADQVATAMRDLTAHLAELLPIVEQAKVEEPDLPRSLDEPTVPQPQTSKRTCFGIWTRSEEDETYRLQFPPGSAITLARHYFPSPREMGVVLTFHHDGGDSMSYFLGPDRWNELSDVAQWLMTTPTPAATRLIWDRPVE